MRLRMGLAQIKPRLGDLRTNLQKHLEFIERARAQQVEMLVFPELSLSGYGLLDLAFASTSRPEADDPIFGPLFKASHDLDLVVGFVERDARQRYYIAAAYLSRGELLHVHRKCYLPTYGLFDEGRHFDQGESIAAFDTRFGRIGMLICEDLWHASPAYLLWLDGADLILLMSASPGRGLDAGDRPSSVRWVERTAQAYAALFTNYIAHALRVGSEDGYSFWGGSVVFDPSGEIVAQAPYHEEALLVADLDLAELRRVRERLPLLRDERPELTLRTLRRILEDRS